MSRFTEKLERDELVLGTYASFASPLEIEVLGEAGLDFVRLDASKYSWSDETIAGLVDQCRRSGMAAWARTSSNPEEIARFIGLGVDALTVPSVDSADEARAIVAAASGRGPEFLLGCQVETRAGLDDLTAIVATPGVDIVHSGRTDLARALIGSADQFDSRVIDAEKSIIAAARGAGKIVALMYPADDAGLAYVHDWIQHGIRVFALDLDTRVLGREYRRAVERLLPGRGAGQ